MNGARLLIPLCVPNLVSMCTPHAPMPSFDATAKAAELSKVLERMETHLPIVSPDATQTLLHFFRDDLVHGWEGSGAAVRKYMDMQNTDMFEMFVRWAVQEIIDSGRAPISLTKPLFNVGHKLTRGPGVVVYWRQRTELVFYYVA